MQLIREFAQALWSPSAGRARERELAGPVQAAVLVGPELVGLGLSAEVPPAGPQAVLVHEPVVEALGAADDDDVLSFNGVGPDHGFAGAVPASLRRSEDDDEVGVPFEGVTGQGVLEDGSGRSYVTLHELEATELDPLATSEAGMLTHLVDEHAELVPLLLRLVRPLPDGGVLRALPASIGS